MEVVVGVLVVWFLLALVVAVAIGRLIRLGGACSTVEHTLTTTHLPADLRPAVSSSPR